MNREEGMEEDATSGGKEEGEDKEMGDGRIR